MLNNFSIIKAKAEPGEYKPTKEVSIEFNKYFIKKNQTIFIITIIIIISPSEEEFINYMGSVVTINLLKEREN
jgi:hypothetical protein